MSMNMGDSKSLTAVVLPVGAPKAVVWSSSDTSVIEVTSNGSVVSKGVGTADAIATAVNGISSSCKVTVKPNPLTPVKITASPSPVMLTMGGPSVDVQFTVEPATAAQTVKINFRDTIMGTNLTNENTAVKLQPVSVGKGVLRVASTVDGSVVCEVEVNVVAAVI